MANERNQKTVKQAEANTSLKQDQKTANAQETLQAEKAEAAADILEAGGEVNLADDSRGRLMNDRNVRS